MSAQHDTDVLIAGAGPTGLVLACELARRGIAFRLVDKATEHFGGSRGDGIHPRTQEVFADLGVLDDLHAAGDGGIPMRKYEAGRLVWEGHPGEPVPATPGVPYPNAWFVPQFRTEEVLRKALAGYGGQVELGVELRALRQDDRQVTARLADGTEIRARYLVGADGGRSTVRRTLGIEFRGETDETTKALIADVRLSGLGRDRALAWSRDGELASVQPLAGTDLFTVTASRDDVEPTPDGLGEWLNRLSGLDLRVHEVHWNSVWRANARLAERYRDGRVLLAGDAAHVCPPTGGQGMNTGVQDAHNLGWKLAAVLRGADEALLDSYEAERYPVAEGVLRLSGRLLDLLREDDPEAHVRGPELNQLGLHYRGGPLAEERRAEPAAVRAGDRAPDAPVLLDGAEVRLFELFAGPHWTLLDFGGTSAGLALPGLDAHAVLREPRPGAVHDVHGHAHDGYGVDRPALLLVRPDGYLGWAGAPGDLADLRAYLLPKLGS
ncbi:MULTISPECIES: FAD-dependent monooxygenase [unclassified Saccharopolyspora]|uniref:FAD-dependent monooxygenase n=1 Tax=unclassified Saccharopolyspora TaxID=2646250 RepID=UPI001CD605EA|nr:MULTISPECIES: FAD-dependent monooxygenase [unclassified Saccharopolyspora]MCA1188124.1 FAD-dependent monooxygenase [Saccharopolyspora sp. 6T]MCA1193414.1 FAD-dependent monooxygenase [Saccharopolyspora sp. 6V]MCA1226894.1 FAD-dependent monooxygenase [Saccharopolyspora sp. 6M]MCA1280647.1 FAD-dependent monooxygenase [Saccharopolyspora sp. 7B]